MNVRKRRFFAGNSIEQALVLAARYHRMEPGSIAYRLVEKRHGFLRFPRRVVLDIDPASPGKQQAPAAAETPKAALPPTAPGAALPRAGEQEPFPAPAAPRQAAPPPREAPRLTPAYPTVPPAPPVASEPPPSPSADTPAAIVGRTRSTLELVLRLAGLELVYDVRMEGGEVRINLSGPDRELLLDDEAELLRAIEHLLQRVLARVEGESLHCHVDTDGFRESHEQELLRLALETAASVRDTRQPVRLQAMSPAERRIVHLTLADQPGVRTESEGDGYFKRVTVLPA